MVAYIHTDIQLYSGSPWQTLILASTNFGGFMQRLGHLTRMLSNQSCPVVATNRGGGVQHEDWIIFKTSDLKLKLGEQFEEITGEGRIGRKVLCTISKIDLMHMMLGTNEGKESFCTKEFMA